MSVPHQMMKALSILVKPFDSLLPEAYKSEGLRVVAGITYWGDNSKAKRELGWQPRPVEDVLREVLEYLMAKQKKQSVQPA